MEQEFNRSHVKAILKPYLRADDDFTTDEPSDDPATKDCEPIERCKRFKIDRHGVWPLDETDVTDREMSEFGQWRPVSVFLDGPDEQDVVGTPMLPFPFTARDLAAFMAYGVGVLVAEHYGDWADGPDPDRLNDIPKHENFARLAVKSAFDAYREAERAVDAYPLALIAKAHLACDAFNKATTEANMREGVSGSIPGTDDSRDGRARAVASVVQQDTEMEAANKEARTAHEAWLNAMVRELLQPAPTQTVTPAPVALVEPATPAPVTVIRHSTKTRRDTLTPVIELAQSKCLNPKDTAEVWAVLLVLAEKRVAPLIGATEEGLQYFKDGGAANFKRKSLGQRVTR